MRVALISATTVHHDPSDGTERLHRLARLLSEHGHEVVVLSAKWWDGTPQTFEHEGITYRAITQYPSDSSFGLRLLRAVRRTRPDVVHATCHPPGHVIGARMAAGVAAVPYILECYDPPQDRTRIGRSLFRSGLRGAGAIVTPSRTVKTRVREFGVPGEKIDVVPTGIDFEAIRDANAVEGGDIVYSRRLDEAANLETLLLALAEFRTYDWRATIVGDGPKRVDYERQARDLRISDRVDFVGEKSVEERIALFKSAHVYVHTAEYTPFAIELLRALACGCVGLVEYHENSSAHELVEREKRGFTATSAQELTDRLASAGDLDRLSVDEQFETYDEEHFLERYLDTYRAVHTG
ncbi:MAG: glycosyltransferase [Halodesulfurarchaeum sp.]